MRPVQETGAPGMILLVEDSPDLRGTVRDMLRDAGHAVIEAASVDEALALLADLPQITALLSDISLEGDRTGLDLVGDLPKGHCPAYLMTSLPPDDPAAYRRPANARRCCANPSPPPQLAAFLQQDPGP